MIKLFNEARRRKIFKPLGVYAVASWIIIQIADTVFPRLFMPSWTVTFVIILVIIGYPVTFFFAWVYDIKPDGIEKTKSLKKEPGKVKKWSLTKKILFPLTGLILTVFGGAFWFAYPFISLLSSQEREYDTSVAILYMEDMSSEEYDFFADGLTEELINRLNRIENLRVSPRTDVAVFKDHSLSIAEIAANLNVDFIVEGSVRFANDNFRISAQLIDVKLGNTVWSESYNKPMAKVFDIQDEIAEKIVSNIELNVSPFEYEELESKINNIEAYKLYLKAQHLLSENFHLNPAKISEIVLPLVEESIKLDSSYAESYALKGLMLLYKTDQIDSLIISSQPEIDYYIGRALYLDPNCEQALILDIKSILLKETRENESLNIFDYRNLAIKGDKLNKLYPESPHTLFINGAIHMFKSIFFLKSNENQNIETNKGLNYFYKAHKKLINASVKSVDPNQDVLLKKVIIMIFSNLEMIGESENAIEFYFENKSHLCGDGTLNCINMRLLFVIGLVFRDNYFYDEFDVVYKMVMAQYPDPEPSNTQYNIFKMIAAFRSFEKGNFVSAKEHCNYFFQYDENEYNFRDLNSIKPHLDYLLGLIEFMDGKFEIAKKHFNDSFNAYLEINDQFDSAIYSQVYLGLTNYFAGDEFETKKNIDEVIKAIGEFPEKFQNDDELEGSGIYESDTYGVYYPLSIYYTEIGNTELAMDYLKKGYELIGKDLLDKYHDVSIPKDNPQFFWVRDIIELYEENLNEASKNNL